MKTRAAYFFCAPDGARYHFDLIPLVEGLRELGVRCVANRDYWRPCGGDGDFLLRHEPDASPASCDAVVFPVNYFLWNQPGMRVETLPVPAGLTGAGRRHKLVFLDSHDGLRTISWGKEFRQFDVIFRSHYNRRCPHPANMQPWAFGISGRMLRALGDAPAWAARRRAMLVNFGASHGFEHSCRRLAAERFLPAARRLFELDTTMDDLSAPPEDPWHRAMWEQTWRRHTPAYYGRLRGAQASACFCGELLPPAPRDPSPLLLGGNRARLRRRFWEVASLLDPRPDRIIQWDSWRFWETLAAGAVAFHVDLDLCGAELPVMPKNGEHYIGVDPRRPRKAIERILDEPGCLARIAAQGRAWALEHYSPQAVARRFLELLDGGTTKHAEVAKRGDLTEP